MSSQIQEDQNQRHRSSRFEEVCYECGQPIQEPYQSQLIAQRICCGVDLRLFCSKECWEKYLGETSRPGP